MVEFFKAIRFTHRLLIALSLVILVFAFSPDPSEKYKQAKQDLESLSDIDFEDYSEYCIEQFNLNEAINTASTYSMNAVDSSSADDFVKCFENEDIKVIQNLVFFIIPDLHTSKVSDFIDFFEESWLVEFSTTKKDMYEAITENEFNCQTLVDSSLYELRLSLVSDKFTGLSTLGQSFYVIELDELAELGFEFKGSKFDWVEFSEFWESQSEIVLVAGFTNFTDDSYLVYSFRSNDNMISPSMTPTKAVGWFARDSLISSYEEALKGIYTVEDEVKGMTIEDGLRYVNKQIELNENHPTLYGVKIDKDIASWIVPLITFSLFLFFLSHIQGFINYVNTKPEFADFPAVVLFNGVTPEFIAITTVFFLPISANILLMFRVATELNFQLVLGIMVITLLMAASILSLKRLRQLKTSLNKCRALSEGSRSR